MAWATAGSGPSTWIWPSRAVMLTPKRVADASHVLVAGAEQRQQRLGTDDRNG